MNIAAYASKYRPSWPLTSEFKEKSKWFVVELLASSTTLAGIHVGSTTTWGASLYLLSLVFWYMLTIKRRLWGLMPLNVATTFVAANNLWKVLAV